MSPEEVDGERNERDDQDDVNQAAHYPKDKGAHEPQDDQHDGLAVD